MPPDPPPGPPPLEPFGLILHHDGRWSHEGQPILHDRLRQHFDRHVVYLPEEGKYVVTLKHFRGEIIVEETAFFVREIDLETGRLRLSDRSEEVLDPGSLHISAVDGAVLCRVKRELAPPDGLPARFDHGAHAELLLALEERNGNWRLRLGGTPVVVPDLG